MPTSANGRILHVDLSNEKLTIEEPPESFYRKYFGGSAMGLSYILKELKPGSDPLGPDNILTMMVSVLTGAPVSGQSRMTASAKSPLTGAIGDSQCGGFFPAEMKFSGFDGIVVRGKAAHPVYLWLHGGQAELRDASHIWGKTATRVEDILREELGDEKIEIAQCGPAGEKLVKLAAIIHMANRANGRTGMGAVMGSKNLKAVVVKGQYKKINLVDGKRLNEIARAGSVLRKENDAIETLHIDGTAGIVSDQHLDGGLPTRNFSEGQFEGYEKISGETMTETILAERDSCFACSVRCKRVVETEWNGNQVVRRNGGPEYETVATLGSYCGVDNLDAVAYGNQLCNEYGLDTIGTGATIAWAMECFENGVLSEAEIGYPMMFGDDKAMIRTIERMARREGFGDVLAEGSRRAANRLGKGHSFLIDAKGAEAPAHMPQVKKSLGLIYSVNPFGADHQSHEHDPNVEDGASERSKARMKLLGFKNTLPKKSMGEDKVRYALTTQYIYSFMDSADLCQFVFGPGWQLYGPDHVVEMVKAVTGWQDFDLEELLLVGKRRLNMMRVFNAREGFTREDDRLAEKFFKPLKGSGPSAGVAVDEKVIEEAKTIYYRLAGWDETSGNPTSEQLEMLGLVELAGSF
jgi:aldehyde:ferredoxin oxidoreductase